WCAAMPMPLIRRAPNYITWPEFHSGLTLTLHPAATGRDDQDLPKRMSMPRAPSAGLERNTCSTCSCRIRRLKERIDSYVAGEIRVGSFARWLCSISLEFHLNSSN